MQLCVALDLPNFEENLALVKKIKNQNIWLKVGLRSYLRDGKSFLDALKDVNPNFKIFLDLKLHDIPNTMADAAEVCANLNVDMFNVHASAGERAMKTVMQRLQPLEKRPLVLAVTALTSFSEDEFVAVYNKGINSTASAMAKATYNAGLDGVVCSVFESPAIKNATEKNFLTLTPGVRPFGEASNDQQRVASLKDAKENLSDFIVVGRPIYQAKDPLAIVEKILSS